MDESEFQIMSICSQDIEDCYEAYIPGPNNNETINYYIKAADYSGRIETLPMAGYYSFQAIGGIVGDLNLDGVIDILDIITLVNYVLNNVQNQLSDLNNDSQVDILDIIILVNLALEN